MNGTVRIAIATGAFALIHSAFASRRVKDAAARRLPHGRALYRVFFNAQALLTFGVAVSYIARQPSRTIYRVRGAGAVALRAAQLGGIAFAVVAARATGVSRLAGTDNVMRVLRGESTRPAPAAQGPELEDDGTLAIKGPFTLARHPLNLAPLPPFWLTPHMTTRRLVFNLVATAYLIAGSYHEETRLLAAYGDRYERYRRSGVPFYLPFRPSLDSRVARSRPLSARPQC